MIGLLICCEGFINDCEKINKILLPNTSVKGILTRTTHFFF